ncbi:MAG: FAD-dependent thymidylate synthase [Actinomycetota bacterium]
MSDPAFTPEERARLARHVTDVDGPVFALTNLPEVVKGALFARYSRSPKSLRRLLLDEFLPPHDAATPTGGAGAGEERAEALYDRVLAEYGDDSVAQLGAAHVAVEGASNVLTKVLEWGRLASYLEQSTRYIAFTDRPGGRYRYHRPERVMAHPELGRRYVEVLDAAFDTYGELIPRVSELVDTRLPRDDATPEAARARAVRARALDALRGLLPAATTANVGIFASGQAFEALLIRLAAHPLPEARACGESMLRELRKVIPAFLTRVDREDRGVRHARYLAQTDADAAGLARELLPDPDGGPDGPAVRLVDHDPDGEERVVAHALWPASGLPLSAVRDRVRAMSPAQRAEVLRAYVGERGDRRHRPGRAFEATGYTFEVVCDYGAYRDLQRHRLLTLQAQPLTPDLGFDVPEEVAAAGVAEAYARTQEACAGLARDLAAALPPEAPYAVTLAHRIRFTMTMNAREAMHLVELRSQPQGHDSYRWVAQEMHRLIADAAGHRALAGAMRFVDTSRPVAGRLAAERRQEERRAVRDAARH